MISVYSDSEISILINKFKIYTQQTKEKDYTITQGIAFIIRKLPKNVC